MGRTYAHFASGWKLSDEHLMHLIVGDNLCITTNNYCHLNERHNKVDSRLELLSSIPSSSSKSSSGIWSPCPETTHILIRAFSRDRQREKGLHCRKRWSPGRPPSPNCFSSRIWAKHDQTPFLLPLQVRCETLTILSLVGCK
jgi:hypothetical protein